MVNKPPPVSILPPRMPIIFDVSAVFQSEYRRRRRSSYFRRSVSVVSGPVFFYLHYHRYDTTTMAFGSGQQLLLFLLLLWWQRRSIRDNKLHSIILFLLHTLILFHPRVPVVDVLARVIVSFSCSLALYISLFLSLSFRRGIDL